MSTRREFIALLGSAVSLSNDASVATICPQQGEPTHPSQQGALGKVHRNNDFLAPTQ